MQLILEVKTGLLAGHKTWLKGQQALTVGRTEWADFTFRTDQQMADVHFAIQATPAGCHIRNMQPSAGTIVNGQPVAEGRLHSGDEIQAGNTLFRVTVNGEEPKHAPDERQTGGQPKQYRSKVCPSELTVYSGSTHVWPASDVAQAIAERFALYLLVRRDLLPEPLPSPIARSRDNVPALDNPQYARYLPVLVPADQLSDVAGLLQAAWSKGAVVGIFSHRNQHDVLAHLRNHSGSFSGADTLQEQLTACPPAFVANLFDGLDAMMTPDAKGDIWRVYVNSQSKESWQRLGFDYPPQASGKPEDEVANNNLRSPFED